MGNAPLPDKVQLLTDGWPVLVVREDGVLNPDERRHAMVALRAAVLAKGGLYGLVLDLQFAGLLSVVDRDLVGAFGRAAGRTCRAVAAVTHGASGPVTAMLWARALQQDVALVCSVAAGTGMCRRALGLTPVEICLLYTSPSPRD